ncbi:unnamed protein product [Paramecium pentaurelia]|uniref:IQ calmodulin-binding motif protein n=1 Tax=Paramecium pentaurelia TaxID=43138 RepID=A0A8S1TNL4_9CILI|nr:unnamed protein product [Paramecium pentaurelia]
MNNNSLIQVQVQDYVESQQSKSNRKLISKKIQPYMKSYGLKPEFFEVKGKQILFKTNNSTNLSNLNKTMFSSISTMKLLPQRKPNPKKIETVRRAVVSLSDFQILPLTTKYSNLFQEIQNRDVSQVQSDYPKKASVTQRSSNDEFKEKNKHERLNFCKQSIQELEKIKQVKIEEIQNLQKRIESVKMIEKNNNSQVVIKTNRNLNKKYIRYKAATIIQAQVKRWIAQKRFKEWKNKKLEKLKKIITIQKWWQKQLKLIKNKDKFQIGHNDNKIKYIDDHGFIIISNYSYQLKRIRILLIERKGKHKQDFRFYLNINNCQSILNEEITKDSYEFNILIDLITNQIINIIHIKNNQIKLDLDQENIIYIERLLLQISISISQILSNKYQVVIFKQEAFQIENQDQQQIQSNKKLDNNESIENNNDQNNLQVVVDEISKTSLIKQHSNELQEQPSLSEHNSENQNEQIKKDQSIQNIELEIEIIQIQQIHTDSHPNNNEQNNINQDIVDIQDSVVEEQKQIDQDNFIENKEEQQYENDQSQTQQNSIIKVNNEQDQKQDIQQQDESQINNQQVQMELIYLEDKDKEIQQLNNQESVVSDKHQDEEFNVHINNSEEQNVLNDIDFKEEQIGLNSLVQKIDDTQNQTNIDISLEIQKKKENHNINQAMKEQILNDDQLKQTENKDDSKQLINQETQHQDFKDDFQPYKSIDNNYTLTQQIINQIDSSTQNNFINNNDQEIQSSVQNLEQIIEEENNNIQSQQVQKQNEDQIQQNIQYIDIQNEENQTVKFQQSTGFQGELFTSQIINTPLQEQDSLEYSPENSHEIQPIYITTLIVNDIDIDVYQLNLNLTFKDKNNLLVECIYNMPNTFQYSLDFIKNNLYVYIMENHIRCLLVDHVIKIYRSVKKQRFIKSVLFYLKQNLILISLYKTCYMMQILIYKNDKLEEQLSLRNLNKQCKLGLQKHFMSISPQLIFCQGQYEQTILNILEKLGCKN